MSEAGLKAVFLANRPLVERMIAARTRDQDEAEDVAQELWLRLDQVKVGPVRQPLSFVMRMALNLALDRSISRSRRIKRDHAWSGLQPRPEEYPDLEQRLVAQAELDRVMRAIHEMPGNMARALIMYRLEGYPQGAIAQRLGMSLSGVEKLLARAYRKLAELREGEALEVAVPANRDESRSKSDVG